MKKVLFCTTFLLYLTCSFAQTRENENIITLEYKSKVISNAKYWHKDNGKWKSRSCHNFQFEEGVQSENFNTIFIGSINSLKFLFIDYYKAEWEYPNLKLDWRYYRKLHGALITDNDYTLLKDIQLNKVVNIISSFNFDMYKGNKHYSFPYFLDLMNTIYSSSQILYNSYKKHEGEEYANRKYKEENPPKYILWVKRTMNNNKDVIRFSVFPVSLDLGKPIFTDNFYFEISYEKYMNLFKEDKRKTYK